MEAHAVEAEGLASSSRRAKVLESSRHRNFLEPSTGGLSIGRTLSLAPAPSNQAEQKSSMRAYENARNCDVPAREVGECRT